MSAFAPQEDVTQVPGYAPDGLNSNQNAAVDVVRSLGEKASHQDIATSLSTIGAAIRSNKPKITMQEAVEIWQILFVWYKANYKERFGTELMKLLNYIEAFYPDVNFA